MSIQSLRSAAYNVQLPMSLQLVHAGQTQSLQLQQVLRVLPGKRVVALAQWQGQRVLAKLFIHRRRWKEHLQRETHGVEAMQNAGIASAGVIAQGEFPQHKAGVLLLTFLENGASLAECYQTCTDLAARHELVLQAVTQIAQCHNAGLLQKDIHLDNFLLRGTELFLLDAASIVVVRPGEKLPLADCLQNLALFLAQFPVNNDQHIATYLAHYHAKKGTEGFFKKGAQGFIALVHTCREQRWQTYKRKLYRETSAHCRRQSWSKLVIFKRSLASEDMERFISDPDAFIAKGSMLKDGNSATVSLIQIGAAEYVIKRYNIKNLWHKLRRLVRRSRASISWSHAHMLQMLGLPSAQPCLLMERRSGPLRHEVYFLAEHVDGEEALQFMVREPINGAPWQSALQRFRELFQVMRQYRIVHGDMKATNFLITPHKLVILDLDAMHQVPNEAKFLKGFERDLKRFAQNWKGNEPVYTAVNQLINEFVVTRSDTTDALSYDRSKN